MTPMDMARNLVRSNEPKDVALGVGIVARGLSDDDPKTLRQGWPLDRTTVEAAAEYLGVVPTHDLVGNVLATAPFISDAMLNKEGV